MKLSIRLILLASLLAALTGCGAGDHRTKVSGKVNVAGKGGLTGGTIRFVSVADPNRVGGGQIKPDGTFEVAEAPVGECKVVIDNAHLDPSNNKSTGPSLPGAGGGMPGGMKGMPGGRPGAPVSAGPKEADKEKMAGGPKGVEITSEMNQSKADHVGEKFVKIDAVYTKADTTTLKATVNSTGPNTFDFDVK